MKNNMLKGLALSAFILILTGCGKKSETIRMPEANRIKTVSVDSAKITLPVAVSGFLVPAKEIRLSFKTGGIILSVNADEGSHVKKGQLLATLDIAEIEAQVNQAVNGYDKALRDYNRAKNLYEDSVVTLEQFQNAETAFNVAKAVRDAAVFNREHSRIIAPENGVILKRLAQSREVIGPGYPVFIFGTTDTHWKVKAGLADKDFVRIMPGDSAIITFDAYPGEKFRGSVSQLSEASNPVTGTYEAELDLLPVNKRLAAGFLAKLEIYPSRAQMYYRIPVEAIVEADGRRGYVYVIDDSLTAVKTVIRISEIYQAWAAVDSGLEADQTVATEGSGYLSNGSRVEIVK